MEKKKIWIETLQYPGAFDKSFRMNITAIDRFFRGYGFSLEFWNSRTLYDACKPDEIWVDLLNLFLKVYILVINLLFY